MLGSTTYGSRQSFAFGRGGIYGLDLARVDSLWLFPKQTNKQTKNNDITDTPLNTIILVVIRERILPDKMTPVLYPILMNYTLDVSIHDVKRLIDVK